jgi:hypothetical protein
MATKKVIKKAPARKKAVAKKAVSKKASPARKKVVAKKVVAKKKPPVRKKAVAKKAVAKKVAPARKKAVTKKAVAKKSAPARKKVALSKGTHRGSLALPVPEILWIDKELELPKFLQTTPANAKKEIVATQQYVEKKNKYPKSIFLAIPILLLIVSVFLISPSSLNKSDLNKVDSSATNESSSSDSSAGALESQTASTASNDKQSQATGDQSALDPATLGPLKFESKMKGQEITFNWKTPVDAERVIGYELSVKKSGSKQWIVISSQTPAQMSVSVDLMSLSSISSYRIASVLDNGEMVFNRTILKLSGDVE